MKKLMFWRHLSPLSRRLAFGFVVVLGLSTGLALLAGRAEAMPTPPAAAAVTGVLTIGSELQLELLLNGDCSGTGAVNITSSGTRATGTLVDGAVYSVSCDAAVHQRQGSSVTVSFTATPTTFGEKLAASPDKLRFVQHGTSYSVISVTGTANCVAARCH